MALVEVEAVAEEVAVVDLEALVHAVEAPSASTDSLEILDILQDSTAQHRTYRRRAIPMDHCVVIM